MSVTMECELDPIFPDLSDLFRNIFGHVKLVDDVIVNVVLFSASNSLIIRL